MLSSTVNIPQDPENEEGVIQSITVQGFGFYANADGSQNGFFIDEVSFSAEKRTFLDEYVSNFTISVCMLLSVSIVNCFPFVMISIFLLLVPMAYPSTTSP